ncbi:guanine deaminase [Ascoidea rubescens DSM 1968]|uniref:Probable guanine deaminase n=1 Tax=Ascoidea rubescens DSM 1968 TaxID=1344418 RepID=A0A1D2VBG5_9ASCO|nr:guanine deaminase [Ascoidea rubescens DSM 1968]ODV58951.1 guanine deaminase [Ascoidea rubescens DSM 1968]
MVYVEKDSKESLIELSRTKYSPYKELENIESLALSPLAFSVYHGTLVHTPQLGEIEILPNCSVGVNTEGTIVFINKNSVDAMDDALKFDSRLNVSNIKLVDIRSNPYSFFFPGFVDTHIHAPQYPNCGIFGNSTLLDWLTRYTFPLEASFKNLQIAKDIYSKVVKKTLRNGTTTASYFATIDANATNVLANLCFKNGQRGLIGRVCMNDNSPDYYVEDFEQSKKSTEKVLKHIKNLNEIQESVSRIDKSEENLILPIITPRFAPSCTSDLLSWLGDLSEEKDLHIQTHISENVEEIEWVKKLFPESKNYAAVYDDHKLLTSKTVLAHAIHLNEDEKKLIKLKKSGVSHCPISNSSITSGEARVRWLLDDSINVGLGTDVSGGFAPSILSTARHALLVSRHLAMKTFKENDKLTVSDVLYLATLGGAKVLSLEELIGDFQVGKKWDCQLVNLRERDSQVDIFSWQLPEYFHNKLAKEINQDEKAKDKIDLSDNLRFMANQNEQGLLKEEALLQKNGELDLEDNLKFENLIAKWLFNGDDRNNAKVWTNGRLVFDKEKQE